MQANETSNSSNEKRMPGASEEALRRAREWGRNHRTTVIKERNRRANIEFPFFPSYHKVNARNLGYPGKRPTRYQLASRRVASAQSRRYPDDPGNSLTSESSSPTNRIEEELWLIRRG